MNKLPLLQVRLFHACLRALSHQVTGPACLRDMALVDSSAAFKQRCMALDHSGELWKGLAAEQVETFAQLAFVLGTPQGPPGQEQFEQLARKVWESPSLGDLAHLRLLLSEASTLAAAHPEAPVFPATKEAPACSSSSATRAQPESFSIGPHPQRTVRPKHRGRRPSWA